jgi:hypothetical protein
MSRYCVTRFFTLLFFFTDHWHGTVGESSAATARVDADVAYQALSPDVKVKRCAALICDKHGCAPTTASHLVKVFFNNDAQRSVAQRLMNAVLRRLRRSYALKRNPAIDQVDCHPSATTAPHIEANPLRIIND